MWNVHPVNLVFTTKMDSLIVSRVIVIKYWQKHVQQVMGKMKALSRFAAWITSHTSLCVIWDRLRVKHTKCFWKDMMAHVEVFYWVYLLLAIIVIFLIFILLYAHQGLIAFSKYVYLKIQFCFINSAVISSKIQCRKCLFSPRLSNK